METLHLYTLHHRRSDLSMAVALIARSPREAASFVGAEYRPMTTENDAGKYNSKFEDGRCVCSSNVEELGLCGYAIFHPELFRKHTGKEIGQIGWDPGMTYDRIPGLVLFQETSLPVELFMRQHNIYIPEAISVSKELQHR